MNEKEELVFQLENLVEHINELIRQTIEVAKSQNITPHKMRNMDGTFSLAPLLIAKAQALSAITHLKFPN